MASGNAPELDADATLADALDLALWLVHDVTGIDLEADFFDHLSGQAILAVRDFDFDAVADDPAANAIDVMAMMSYREGAGDGLADTMDKVANLLRDHVGLAGSSVDVGADGDATVFDLGLLGALVGAPIGYRPGYVLHDRYLTLGTTENALEIVVKRQNGEVRACHPTPSTFGRRMSWAVAASSWVTLTRGASSGAWTWTTWIWSRTNTTCCAKALA